MCEFEQEAEKDLSLSEPSHDQVSQRAHAKVEASLVLAKGLQQFEAILGQQWHLTYYFWKQTFELFFV